MCIIMPPKSKVELSPHYNEIVDLLLSGNSGRYVSDYLLNEYDEKISYVALNNYKKNKLNVKSAAKKKLIEKEKKKIINEKVKTNEKFKESITREAEAEISLEAATQPVIKNYERSDKFLELTEDIDLVKEINDYKKSPDFDEAKFLDLLIKVFKLRLDNMKFQSDLFEENTLDVNVNNASEDLYSDEDVMRFINESKSRNG